MGLPHELLQYAENIYRRFPEEFLALGQPGLEQIFDLRVEGSRSRRIAETPTEKTVEITIRRWQPSQMPPLHPSYNFGQDHGLPMDCHRQAPLPAHLGYYPAWHDPTNGGMPAPGPPQVGGPPPNMSQFGGGPAWSQDQHRMQMRQQPQQSTAPTASQATHAEAGGPPHNMPQFGGGPAWTQDQHRLQMREEPQQSTAPTASQATHAEAQMTSRLASMEATLSTMMPLMEMAIQSSRNLNDHRPAPVHVQPVGHQPAGRKQTESPDNSPHQGTPMSPLRLRRGVNALQISKPANIPKVEKTVEDPGDVRTEETNAKVIPKLILDTGSQSSERAASPNGTADDKQKKERVLRITTQRVVPNANDPESPRSPGRYSAWK